MNNYQKLIGLIEKYDIKVTINLDINSIGETKCYTLRDKNTFNEIVRMPGNKFSVEKCIESIENYYEINSIDKVKKYLEELCIEQEKDICLINMLKGQI